MKLCLLIKREGSGGTLVTINVVVFFLKRDASRAGSELLVDLWVGGCWKPAESRAFISAAAHSAQEHHPYHPAAGRCRQSTS